MGKFLPIGFLLNIFLIVYAFKVWGLILIIILAIGLYRLVLAKFPNKSAMAEKAMFASGYIMGVFALHSVFDNSLVTAFGAVFEAIFFFIFAAI